MSEWKTIKLECKSRSQCLAIKMKVLSWVLKIDSKDACLMFSCKAIQSLGAKIENDEWKGN